MLFSDISLVDENFQIAEHRWVGVKDGRIAYIGNTAPDASLGDFGETYQGAGKVLMPGLYNAHTHVPMTLLRGYAEGLPLQSWLQDRVWPFEAFIDDDAARPATLLAIAEMLRTGTVSFTDMYYQSSTRAQCVLESGIKANLSEGVICFDGSSYDELPVSQHNKELFGTYHGAGDGRLKWDLCIHAEYTSNPALVQGVGQAAAEMGVCTEIHLSETKSEHEECKQRHDGMTPTRYFDSLGFFEAPCTAAHAVWSEPDDWKIMAERGVTVAHCGASNLKLGSGIAPIPDMLEAGVNVALGTDGVASNNNHDLLNETYLLALLHKGFSLDPTLISPGQALRCATLNGARSQQRNDCGLVKEGFRADLVVLDASTANMNPAHDLLANIAFSANSSNIILTMVDGKVLYRDGEFPTIDVERAIAETNAAASAIAKKAAEQG